MNVMMLLSPHLPSRLLQSQKNLETLQLQKPNMRLIRRTHSRRALSTAASMSTSSHPHSIEQQHQQQQQLQIQLQSKNRLFRPALNYKLWADSPTATQDNINARSPSNNSSTPLLIKNILNMHADTLKMKHDISLLRQKRNSISAEMKAIMKSKSQNDPSNLKIQKDILIAESHSIKNKITSLESVLSKLEADLYAQARHVPNTTHSSVPIGPESNAVVEDTINTWILDQDSRCKRVAELAGIEYKKPWNAKDHVHIAEHLQMVDFERAGKVTGSGFYYLKGVGALLEMALSRYAMDFVMMRHKKNNASDSSKEEFVPICVPDLVRYEVVEACGFSPRSEDPQTYFVDSHLNRPNSSLSHGVDENVHQYATGVVDPMKMCLSATAEFSLAAMHAGETFEESNLPMKFVGIGRAFRAEGLAGALNRGLYRVHQFSKVEMFALTNAKESHAKLEEFKSIQRDLFESLGLCFRILNMPTEELGAPAHKKYDMEAWMPGRQAWGEISSTSNCTDYQSRRLSIKYFTSDQGTTDFVHTVNGTAAAIPRLIIAILETFQLENGDVVVPPTLVPYMNNIKILKKKEIKK